MGKPKVPSTISDKKMASLQRRARRASTESWISGRAIARRKAANEQFRKRALS